MLIIAPKLYKQRIQQLQLASIKTKMENRLSAFSMKTTRKTQRQILASLVALPVSEALDKNSYADSD